MDFDGSDLFAFLGKPSINRPKLAAQPAVHARKTGPVAASLTSNFFPDLSFKRKPSI